MPKRRQLTKPRTPKQLLRTLVDNPALPAFVRTLQTPVLHKLIERVGVRDAGELIALTTPEQLRGLFEVSLWETLAPGESERLRPEKFVEWLDVMLEVGVAFTVERLLELGETFVVLNLAPLITVIDRGVAAEHQEDPCYCVLCELAQRDVPFEMIGEYIVTGPHEDEWDVIKTVLVELEGEDARFLDRVLARCSTAPTMRDFTGDDKPLLHDETHDREQRRERAGFVTPPIAAAFLAMTRKAPLDALLSQPGYDDISRRYFEQIAAAAAAAAEERARAIAEPLADDDEEDRPTITPVQMRALEDVLIDAEIIGDRQPLLLQGPKAEASVALELQGRLDRLRFARPDVFASRLGELVYLANILMAGSWYQGARFSETDAAQAALACANLGLDRVLSVHEDALERAQAAEALLECEPGIVGLFRIGWHLLQRVPMDCATRLLDALRSEHVREQLVRKRWILDEIESAVSDPDLLEQIELGEFEDVGDNLLLLSLVLDARACQCLRTLISDFPRYPIQLELGFRRPKPSTNEHRYFTTMHQLARVHAFVEDLDALLKV